WTFFAPYEGVLQIGALVGDGDGSRAALLGATIASPPATTARAISCFLYPQSPQLASTLSAAGFLVERHLYLGADLRAVPLVPAAGFTCEEDAGRDVAGIAALLRRSYGRSREASCFAPDGLPHQWEHYVSGLLVTEGCGRYLPLASLAMRDARGELAGATLVSGISADTAHLAQVAIDPACRGGGLGKALVQESCRAARALGFRRMTLLVAEGNTPARDLYARLGFSGDQAFLHAVRS
ncbi:MAG: GNAT family N-acetyltransferase, partial [Acidobacteria bacterium]